ncbi:M23 family metallopeptidase [Erythrobacter sp. W302b]|uniref:M23 family metallopeptidase n=1 Tax=Erythrobacter sp. W302b TaxID=3389874 RepID=UPI00396B08C6
MVGMLMSTPAMAQDEQLVRLTDIVPSGRAGVYAHGTFPSEGDRTHAGIDIPAPCKTSSVRSWRDGVVIDLIDSKKDRNFKSLGYMIIIDHGVVDALGKRTFSSYFHLNDAPKRADGRKLTINDTVAKAEQIGFVGETGAAQGCHLHFELRHFSSRFSPDWLNIYGQGNRRSSPEFLRDWTDPYLKTASPAQSGAFATYGPVVEARVTAAARERNKPSTTGSTILRTFPAGTTIKGTWVGGTDGNSRWLKTGSSSFVWDGNLSVDRGPAPVAAQTPVREGFTRVHELSGTSVKGTLSFDEPLKLLSDTTECTKAQKSLIKKLSRPRASCVGAVTTPGHDLVLAENWLISEANPGIYQLIWKGVPVGDVAAVPSGAVSAFEDLSGNLVIVSSEARERSKTTNLPYVLYRIEGNRLIVKASRNFAKGQTPADRNRRDFLAAVEKARVERAAEDQRREAARLAAEANAVAAQSRQASSPVQSTNPNCQFARWSGVIENVGDMFLCDEARAIEFFAAGAQVLFKPSSISFNGGRYVATMKVTASDVRRSNERMQRDFNWGDWMNVTQNIASPTTIVCRFSSPAIRSGEQRVVRATLESYSRGQVILNCS